MKQCKYCRKNDHIIDDCPNIICKTCEKIGHPYWNCKNNLNKLFLLKDMESLMFIKWSDLL